MSKKGYKDNIEKLTTENISFRKVLYTGEESQLVLMSLIPGEEIGNEVHPDNDQFFRFESGNGDVRIDDSSYSVGDGDAIIVPKGARHNVVNTGKEPLKFYTIYSPAHHKDGVEHVTKEQALSQEGDFDGITTE